MPDLRPRLVKSAKPIAPISPPKPSLNTRAKISHTEHRHLKLKTFEEWLGRRPEQWARRTEVLPYFRAMIEARLVRSRPVSLTRKRWLFSVDPYLAARELFRLAYNQHCESVTWSPDDAA